MHQMLVWLAMGLGIVIAHLYDPLVWVLLAIAVLMGAQRHAWWRMLLVVIVFTGVNVAMIYTWWIETGIGYHHSRVGRIFFALLVIGFAAYGGGRLIARLIDRMPQRRDLSSGQ